MMGRGTYVRWDTDAHKTEDHGPVAGPFDHRHRYTGLCQTGSALQLRHY